MGRHQAGLNLKDRSKKSESTHDTKQPHQKSAQTCRLSSFYAFFLCKSFFHSHFQSSEYLILQASLCSLPPSFPTYSFRSATGVCLCRVPFSPLPRSQPPAADELYEKSSCVHASAAAGNKKYQTILQFGNIISQHFETTLSQNPYGPNDTEYCPIFGI